MKTKRIYLLVLLFLVCILSITAISATENTTNKDVISADNNKENNLETNIHYDDISTSEDNCKVNLEENDENKESKSGTDKTTTINEEPLTFTDLNTAINGNINSTVYLSNNYKYNDASDNVFINGIPLSRDLTIYSNEVTIDGSNMAKIFNVCKSGINVQFYNITFINGNSEEGGAVYGGESYYCTFIGNNATKHGGAIYKGNSYNCTFINNTANYGGAISNGNAYNCTFTSNTAKESGGAMYFNKAYNCVFTSNTAREDGGAIYMTTAYNSTFNKNSAGEGGAIYMATAYNSTFTENDAGEGGAIFKGHSYNCTFTKNTASGYGGAIYGEDAYNSTFTENSANSGGAIYNGNSFNCTFIRNTVSEFGGAIFVKNAYNCVFIGNTATRAGGAISLSSAYNCTFINNTATKEEGGAIKNGNATNCTFKGNNATQGQAMYDGNAILCIFNGDTTSKTTIIPAIINVINYTSTYSSEERLKFNLTASDMVFDGVNTTIKIYKDNELYTTVYGLTGEGWIVDLNPGTYTAELSLTDYPDEKPSNATIEVLKINTTIFIDPIINPEIEKEITINYTSNRNETATIKVNGQEITDGKFTPTKPGTYNVSVEITENEYYTEGLNQTTFTIEKTNTTVYITPITNTKIGEEIKINYTANSNATAKIKVNGEEISDCKFTPTHEGIYNLTVEITENEYYTAATNETTFTVGKLASKITASPVTTTYNVDKYLIITLKDQNGKPISKATVTVKLASTKKYKTNSKGQVKINITTLTPKTYNAKITYGGSDIYKSSTGLVKVTVKKATPKITAKPARFKLKVKTKKYTAYFKDNKNKALKNTKVTLKVNGKTYTTKTNSKGQATFKITNLKKKGTYTGFITVPANQYYNKISKKVKIIVKQ